MVHLRMTIIEQLP